MEFGKENNSNVINKATVLEFSPVKSMSTKEKPLTGTNTGNDIISTSKASLLCTKFQNPAWIEFGNVIVGSINSQRFELINPSETKSVHICKAQDPKNISISFGPQNESEVVIPPRQKVTGAVIWSPNDDVAIRETVVLKMDRKAPLQLIIHGVAGLGNVSSKCRQSSLKYWLLL